MSDAQFVSMMSTLRDSVGSCQRHSVIDFRSNAGMDTIGSRIRSERERQHISRAELARFAGIAASTLSDLELGLSKSTTALHRIAEKLAVSVDWLETGREPKAAQASNSSPSYQPVRPDPAILLATQGFLEKAYSGLGKKFSLMTDADLFADVYEWIAEDDRPVDQRNLVDFAQWRAKKAEHGGVNEQNGQADGQAAGADRRRAAG